jgi:VanZ family protein
MLWAVVVLLLSTMSGDKVEEIPFMSIPHMDKLAHFGMYFLFTSLLLFDLSHFKGKAISWRQIILYSLVLAVAYGGIMELLQEIRVLHRSTDIKDFIANSAGAFTAVFCYKYVVVFFNKFQSVFIKPGNNYSL